MSHPDFILAIIREWPPKLPSGHLDFESTYALTDAALADLPETDPTWPPLIRSMVAVPKASERFAAFGGRRAISVSVHSNHLFEGLPGWLDKFEQRLLRRVLWSNAQVFYSGEHLCGDHWIEYFATRDLAHSDRPTVPPRAWTFRVRKLEQTEAVQWGIMPDFRTRPGYREDFWPKE